MRTILFRGKDIETGQWLYGYYSKNTTGTWPLKDVIYPSADAEAGFLHYEEISPVTLGQYIGATDYNNTPIFEGDVVDLFGERYLIVYFEKAQRFAPAKPNGTIGNFDIGLCVVVGNIHDNPELMEAKPE